MVEFVSANPTGPLHLGHARQAALGDAIASLLDDPGRRAAMGRAARSFAQGFSWDRTADAFEEILETAAAEASAPGEGRVARLPPAG